MAPVTRARCDSCGRTRRIVTRLLLGVGRSSQEDLMAKGQMKSNKEGKKPKSDKPKSSVSEYKKSQGGGGQGPLQAPGKKK